MNPFGQVTPSNNEYLEDLANQYAEQREKEEIISPLLTPAVAKERFKLEYFKAISEPHLPEQLNRAVSIIRDEGESLLETVKWDRLFKEMSQASSHEIDSSSKENRATQQGISDESLEAVDDIVRIKFEEEKNDDALSLLIWLTTMAENVQEYWFELGVFYQERLEDFENAVAAYDCSLEIKEDHIESKAFRAECFIKLNKPTEARKEWNETLVLIQKQNKEQEWKEFADTMSLLLGTD